MTEQEQRDLERRRKEDFDFMVLCSMKGNMAMYELLRDKSLYKSLYKQDPQAELPFDKKEGQS